MNIRPTELKVFYGGGLNEPLDEEIEEILKKYGYVRWASGYDLISSVRDLAFDKEDDRIFATE